MINSEWIKDLKFYNEVMKILGGKHGKIPLVPTLHIE